MMDFDPGSDHESIRAGVRDLTARFPDEYWRKIDEGHAFPWEFYDAMAEAGWLGIAIPEEYGGGGLGVSEAALLLEEVARSGAAMNGCSPLHLTIFGINTIAKHGSRELRQEILPRAADGSLHVCFAVTEPDAGTDTSRVSTFARRDAGRADDVIISAGWTISPLEVERTLLTHPQVTEAAVVGVPDETRGHVVKAFVVPSGTADDRLVSALQDLVRDDLSPHEYPRKVEFVPDLPKTPNGKINRRALREV